MTRICPRESDLTPGSTGDNDWDDLPIVRVGLLSPNANIAKCGRSTEMTVNHFLQKWSENRVTTEIAIIGGFGETVMCIGRGR